MSLESIAQCLEQLLLPQHARDAELQLRAMEADPGFAITLLHVVLLTNLGASTRLAGALFFKNLVKRRWLLSDGETYMMPADDVALIKREILPALVKLPSQLQVQIGGLITLIAELDFPHRWPTLIDELVALLLPTDFVANRAVLLVMHLIFKKWRPLFRSDELFLEIKLVLDKFAEPFLQLFRAVDAAIDAAAGDAARLTICLDNLLVMVQLYYDLNCQDLPEFFEDHMQELMTFVLKYLEFRLLAVESDDDDDVDVLIKVKTAIVELLGLYVNRYADDFTRFIETFISTVWQTVLAVGPQPKYDLLVVKLLDFLLLVIKIPTYQHVFNKEEACDEIIQKIILPNIEFRDADEEAFEDEPIQFVRLDLEGSEFESRRKLATDFLRELKDVNPQLVTAKVMEYVGRFLGTASDWKHKDIAIYLFTLLATKGTVTQAGVSTVQVDVVGFFKEHILQDLGPLATHPILRMDAIKYIYMFRNQLTKQQLLEAMAMLTNLLEPLVPAIYTYAAITIEKLLAMTDFQTQEPLFTKTDIDAQGLLLRLFELLIARLALADKLSENEFIIKCIMRVLAVAQELLSDTMALMQQLLKILAVIAKNPGNPRFTHYVFELMGLLIKHLPTNEVANIVVVLVPELLLLLGDDVQEFVPYTFQVLAYLLERLPAADGLPDHYRDLLKPLLLPAVWEFKGNIPGITRLLVAIIQADPLVALDPATLEAVLGVFQKLVSLKMNDAYGFELLQTLLLYVAPSAYLPFLDVVGRLLMTRLQNLRTDKFVKRLTMFLLVLAATPMTQEPVPNKGLINALFVVQFFDNVQQGVLARILTVFVIPTVLALANLQDKKVANIGLSELLLAPVLDELARELTEAVCANMAGYEGISKTAGTTAGTTFTNAPLNELDLEVMAFGLTFSPIVAIQNKPFDPVASIKANDFALIERVVFANVARVRPAVAQQLSQETKTMVQNRM